MESAKHTGAVVVAEEQHLEVGAALPCLRATTQDGCGGGGQLVNLAHAMMANTARAKTIVKKTRALLGR